MNKYATEQAQTKKPDTRKKEVKAYIDYAIFPGKVRLVGDGDPKVIERDYAIDMAKSRGMNLVQIAYNKADFPHAVCKIMDYGKYLFDQKKKDKERKRQDRINNAEAKEIVFSVRIDDGDRKTKMDHVREFINDGEKVRITVKLLRREMNLIGMAKDMLSGIFRELSDIAEIDSNTSQMGGIISCTIRKRK